MYNFSKIFLALLLTASTATVFAEPTRFLALDTGYRWDRICNTVNLGGPTVTVKTSTQTLKDINSYQVGGKGEWTFCNNKFFVRGSGHYGFVGGGNYNEISFRGHADGHTWDVQASLGWYCSLNDCVGIAPIIGVSCYNFNLKGVGIEAPVDGIVYDLDDIQATQSFYSPFVGIDLFFKFYRCFDLTLGYEFHYASWTGDRFIEGDEYGNPPFGWTTGYSNERHMYGVIGNVFRIDTSYVFCECWKAGLELKYQFYKGDYGKYKQTDVPLLSQFTYANIDDLEWNSFSAMVYIGKTY